MITVTEQLKNVFEANPLYSKEGQGLNAEVIARFFLPFSSVVCQMSIKQNVIS